MATCGACFHWRMDPTNFKVGVCWGAPPTPTIVPTPQGPQIAPMRCTLNSVEPACGAYKARIVIEG